MRIPLLNLCIDCSKLEGEGALQGYIVDVELRDDNFYNVECPNGHKHNIRLQNQKFELLFDFGALALLDGYTREAVASLAVALERFYEFYIKVILLKQNIPDEEFIKSWKFVSSQSERQLGAFLFMYLLENKKAVNFQDINKHTEFRNKVIHKGYIPSYEEVVKYGEAVLAFIHALLKELKATSSDCITEAIYQSTLEIIDPKLGQVDLAYTLDTIIGFELQDKLTLRGEDSNNYTFKSELEKLEGKERERGYIYSYQSIVQS